MIPMGFKLSPLECSIFEKQKTRPFLLQDDSFIFV